MKIIYSILVSFALLFTTNVVLAFDGITYYGATISMKDHYNSRGQLLRNVRAILRQDRANYHVHYKRDPSDQYDSYFRHKGNRAEFGYKRIMISNAVLRAIKSRRTVNVSVFVYPNKIEVRYGLPSR